MEKSETVELDSGSINSSEITNYFRSNIFSSLASYSAWKVIECSKSSEIVSKEMSEKYVAIQNYHPQFFVLARDSFLTSFVLLVLHPFDTDSRSYSLFKVDKSKTKQFIQNNKDVLDALYSVRNKIFAHRDLVVNNSTMKDYQIPSVISLDAFFQNLIDFYNELCKGVDDSCTIFDNAKNVKYDIEHLFMNLYRGENVRLNDIDVRYLWEENKNKISDVI